MKTEQIDEIKTMLAGETAFVNGYCLDVFNIIAMATGNPTISTKEGQTVPGSTWLTEAAGLLAELPRDGQ
jgi:hypothetical protein